MIWHEMLNDERVAGRTEGRLEDRAEAVLELLEDLGEVSEELRAKIMGETELVRLKCWHKLAAKAENIEQFLQNM